MLHSTNIYLSTFTSSLFLTLSLSFCVRVCTYSALTILLCPVYLSLKIVCLAELFWAAIYKNSLCFFKCQVCNNVCDFVFNSCCLFLEMFVQRFTYHFVILDFSSRSPASILIIHFLNYLNLLIKIRIHSFVLTSLLPPAFLSTYIVLILYLKVQVIMHFYPCHCSTFLSFSPV